jgi:cell division transport system permease protein
VIASAILFLLLNYAYSEIEYLKDLKDPESILTILISIILLGAVIGFLSSLRAVSKYLKMSLDELY